MPKRTHHPRPPDWVEAKRPPVKGDSPWWQDVARDLTTGPLVGMTISIEELTEGLPCYPDGRRPRPRAAARRLRSVLQLVERGPNGSLGKGAKYRIVTAPDDKPPEHQLIDDEWLRQSVERIVGKK